MSDEDEEISLDATLISTIVMNCLIIIITIYLLVLYIKSKEFHSYSCGNILILSFSILLDNAIRLIPIGSDEKYKVYRYIQAFILGSLDKYIPLVLTCQMFTIYLAIMKIDFYYNHKKVLFFGVLCFSLAVSLLMGGGYLFLGIVKHGIYYYVQGEEIKQLVDTIYNSIFLALNSFFSGVVILNTALKKEEIEKGMLNQNDYEHDLYRMILLTFANTLIYVESFLIVWDKLPVPDEFIDLVYIITCLIINLIYAINKLVIQETKNIFCKIHCVKALKRNKTYATERVSSEEMSNRASSYYEK